MINKLEAFVSGIFYGIKNVVYHGIFIEGIIPGDVDVASILKPNFMFFNEDEKVYFHLCSDYLMQIGRIRALKSSIHLENDRHPIYLLGVAKQDHFLYPFTRTEVHTRMGDFIDSLKIVPYDLSSSSSEEISRFLIEAINRYVRISEDIPKTSVSRA